jgi:hypothetical protein
MVAKTLSFTTPFVSKNVSQSHVAQQQQQRDRLSPPAHNISPPKPTQLPQTMSTTQVPNTSITNVGTTVVADITSTGARKDSYSPVAASPPLSSRRTLSAKELQSSTMKQKQPRSPSKKTNDATQHERTLSSNSTLSETTSAAVVAQQHRKSPEQTRTNAEVQRQLQNSDASLSPVRRRDSLVATSLISQVQPINDLRQLEDLLYDIKFALHQDIQNLHLELLQQFEQQKVRSISFVPISLKLPLLLSLSPSLNSWL